MKVSDEAIEAAAEALVSSTLGDRSGIKWEEFFEAARGALVAAAPYMLAPREAPHKIAVEQMGDEGYDRLLRLLSDIAASKGRAVVYVYPEITDRPTSAD